MAVGPIIDKGGSIKPKPPVFDALKYLPAASQPQTASAKAQQTQAKYTNTKTSPTKTTTKKTDAKKTDDGENTGSEGNSEFFSNLGLSETLDIEGLQNQYDAGFALRKFQRDQADRQLKDALSEIDRAAIENYKGISNDYAARGIQRSGGFMGAESSAMAEKTRADEQTNQAVRDFLDMLDMEGTAALKELKTGKEKIGADYLLRRFAGPQGGK